MPRGTTHPALDSRASVTRHTAPGSRAHHGPRGMGARRPGAEQPCHNTKQPSAERRAPRDTAPNVWQPSVRDTAHSARAPGAHAPEGHGAPHLKFQLRRLLSSPSPATAPEGQWSSTENSNPTENTQPRTKKSDSRKKIQLRRLWPPPAAAPAVAPPTGEIPTSHGRPVRGGEAPADMCWALEPWPEPWLGRWGPGAQHPFQLSPPPYNRLKKIFASDSSRH